MLAKLAAVAAVFASLVPEQAAPHDERDQPEHPLLQGG